MHSSLFVENKDLIESVQEMTIDSNLSNKFGLPFKEIVKKKYFFRRKTIHCAKTKN